MRYLLWIFNSVLDTLLAWFSPIWRRQGHDAASLLGRYIHQHRPQMKEERLAELTQLRAELRAALLYWQKEKTLAAVERAKALNEELPGGLRRNMMIEMVESLFVLTVVFLGIRTYFVQPFRIPTNSMWPSLNGIVVHPVEEKPALPQRLWDMITLGSSYVDATADSEKRIVKMREKRKWLLFTETIIHFDDGSTLAVPSAPGAVMQYLRQQGKMVQSFTGGILYLPYRKGETIMRARIDAGDMVLVNRMAYHFRHPKRGETFVFDTRGINTSGGSSTLNDQSSGTHYIKRLCALPGDCVRIEEPNVLINGKVCADGGMHRVEERQAPYDRTGYVALDARRVPMAYITTGSEVKLSAGSPRAPWLREYLALGDNTLNSLDSRYWGPVRQFNVLGPASFTLWPFSWHWGSID